MNTGILQIKQMELWSSFMPLRTKIILLSGRIGVGKTATATQLLIELRKGFKFVYLIPFAKMLKQIAVEYFMWDLRKDNKGRKLLQQLGNVGREYYQDIWVDYVLEEIDALEFPPDVVIIDDWRFPNELEKLESSDQFDITKVRVIRNVDKIDNDISETSLTDDMSYDYVIDNNGTLDDLVIKVNELINFIFKN